MHGSVLGFFAYGALGFGEVEHKDVLEVGSLNVNGSVRPLVERRRPESYLGIDVVEGSGVDRVVDAVDISEVFGTNKFDMVISTEMLEHAEDWQSSIRGMVDVLKPGGVIIITTRSVGFQYHHPPDHWRYTQKSFREIFNRYGFSLLLLMDDPEYSGVFCKARKPVGWVNPHPDLSGVSGVTQMTPPFNLLGLPMNPDGTYYYRYVVPWTELNASSGNRAIVPPIEHFGWVPTEDDISQMDLVSQQRPAGRACEQEWRRWKDITRLVYETDDDILHPDTTLPHLLDETRQESIRTCLRMAHAATCSTEPLAEILREYNDNVFVIPNTIFENTLKINRPRRDKLVLGWAGGMTHLPDLIQVSDAIELCPGLLDDAEMHFIGVDYSPLFNVKCRFTPWQTNVWNYYNAIDADIGLIPLKETPFNRCRSHIKALEYAALGIPVIASNVEAYKDFIVDGVTGFLVDSPKQWAASLQTLMNDSDLRETMGSKARELSATWTIERNWHRWSDVYAQIIRTGETK